MKKVLLQLDTDEHPSPFDAIVAHDAGVDVLLSHGGVKPEDVRGLVQDAFFTRGIDDLKTMAVWVGGKRVAAGEEVFAAVQKAFFGPFRVSVMLDSNGCNTTAATTIARIAKARSLDGSRAVVLGLGAVGLRSAVLLRQGGLRGRRVPRSRPTCSTTIARTAARTALVGRGGARPRRPRAGRPRRARGGCSTGRRSSCPPGRPACRCCAATSGRSTRPIELLADYNAADPLGIEGTKATDDLDDYDGKLVLGALAIGGPKMKVHKACVRRLFESNDQVLDTDAVYAIAKELV